MVFYYDQSPLDPSVQAERQPLFAIHDNDPFYHKRKRGRLVGKRELAEKHWSGDRCNDLFRYRATWTRDGVINVPPSARCPTSRLGDLITSAIGRDSAAGSKRRLHMNATI
ncbi:hypothetical protein PG990_010632 [Apiospora arundinis]